MVLKEAHITEFFIVTSYLCSSIDILYHNEWTHPREAGIKNPLD